MRTIICDDDAALRAVLTELVQAHGGEVLAEADNAALAISLIERFAPDLVVLDMAFPGGTGLEIVDHVLANDLDCHVVLFTAFDAPEHVDHEPRVELVRKPDLEQLELVLERLGGGVPAADERRADDPDHREPARTRGEVDEPATFYQVLAEAERGDVLVRVSGAGLRRDEVVAALLTVIRAQDRLVPRGDSVIVLLVLCGDSLPSSFVDRLAEHLPDAADRIESLPVADDATAAFQSLTDAVR